MRRSPRLPLLSGLLLFTLTACSGGGGGNGAANGTAATGSVHVVVDTAAGTDALVQVQVAGAVLEDRSGAMTTNVLAKTTLLTIADPSGEASGFVLGGVPSGDYTALHLLVAPGSGAALTANGDIVAVTCAGDVVVPIVDGLLHDRRSSSWLAVGHDAVAPAIAGSTNWTPRLSARLDGQGDLGLRVTNVQAPGVTASLASAGDGVLRVGFDDTCTFAIDDHGGGGGAPGRDDFLVETHGGDDLIVSGSLHRDGSFSATHARRRSGHDGPRLIGRITGLHPLDTSFVFAVQAEVRRNGERTFLTPPVDVLVLAAGARLHRSSEHGTLAFGDLQVGDLAKVEFSARTSVAGDLDQVTASEIEVPGPAAMPQPEWHGIVQSVDVGAGTITVEPWHDDPIVIDGSAVPSVVLTIAADTTIERKAPQGGGHETITLDQVVGGSDRIWWRGEITGPQAIAARWVRVRAE